MRTELPETVRIAEVIEEAEGIKTILFPRIFDARPGQFVMVWAPRIDSKPVGVSYLDKDFIGVTVCAVGQWSEKVCSMKKGEYLGLLGPYGNGFELEGQKVVLVGGGYGVASLMLLAEEALAKKRNVTLIIGARTEAKLLYRKRIEKLGLKAVYTTDDGSFGKKGLTFDALSEAVSAGPVDTVYVCGPEMMEKSIAEFAVQKNLRCYISLERHMKCGFGVCGGCCMDPTGERICVEGPVFTAEKALTFTEFGKYHRDGSATKHYF